jgi:hypothetical protein
MTRARLRSSNPVLKYATPLELKDFAHHFQMEGVRILSKRGAAMSRVF